MCMLAYFGSSIVTKKKALSTTARRRLRRRSRHYWTRRQCRSVVCPRRSRCARRLWSSPPVLSSASRWVSTSITTPSTRPSFCRVSTQRRRRRLRRRRRQRLKRVTSAWRSVPTRSWPSRRTLSKVQWGGQASWDEAGQVKILKNFFRRRRQRGQSS